MSFIKKKTTLQGKSASPSARPMALQAPPQHPMLRWKGVRATKKADHLDHYVEVRPFARAEGTCKKPDGSSCRTGKKTDDGRYQFHASDWKSSKNTTSGKNELVVDEVDSSSSSKKTSSSSKKTSSGEKYDDMNITALKKKGQELRIPKYSSFKNTAKGKRDLVALIREAESSGGSSVLGGTASVLGKAAGWAWGSAENKESVKSKFSAMGAASSGFWWCLENKAACATGAVIGVAGSYLAITAAIAYITAAAAVAAYYSAIGLIGLAAFATAAIAIRSASLKTYEAGEEFASLSTSELKAKIVELKANQCYKIDLRPSCYTARDLLKAAQDALDFQNTVCDGSDCDEVRALFNKEDIDLSEEDIQKRKDLFFGHIWTIQQSAEEDTFAELEANNSKKLQKMCEEFTLSNKDIFHHVEGGHLVKASLTGSRGILVGEYETNDILEVLADKQKEIIGLHSAAVDEWVELSKAFKGHIKLIKQGNLWDRLPEKFIRKLGKARDYSPPSKLLSDGDKDKQMKSKLSISRRDVDRNVRHLQKLVNAIDASEEGSIVAKIQEEKATKECFIESVGEITDIFREYQKEMGESDRRSAEIEEAGIALEKPTTELMRRICMETHFPEDPPELAKWILGRIRNPQHDPARRRRRRRRSENVMADSDSDSDSDSDPDSDSDSDRNTEDTIRSIDDIFSDI